MRFLEAFLVLFGFWMIAGAIGLGDFSGCAALGVWFVLSVFDR